MTKDFQEINSIVTEAVAALPLDRQPCGLYDPVAYILSLGGKRIRPAMVLMASDLFGGNLNEVIDPALGLEIFHNFTLLHDDIMDHAPIRRGKPTVHVRWSENTAILSGDAMQILAYQYIAKAPQSVLKPVLDLFSQTAAEVCEGQQFDMEFEDRKDVSASEYLEMIRLKTAVLLACSLKTGAICAGASSRDADLIYGFGIDLGLAFQLQDDLLDVYGDEKTFGKQIGGDILANKKTYLLIHALKSAQGETAAELNYWLQAKEFDPLEKIRSVRAIYNQLGVDRICRDKMQEHYEKAMQKMEEIAVNYENKQELVKLAKLLMERNS